MTQIQVLPSVGHLAIQCRGSRRTWKFGENPARSRHCVSWTNALPCSSQTLPPTSSVNTGRRNPEEELMSQATQTESVAIATPPFSLIQVLPWLIFAECWRWSPCTSSPLSRAPPRCSPAPQSTSGSTMGATCSASPATEPGRDFRTRLPDRRSVRRPVRRTRRLRRCVRNGEYVHRCRDCD